MKRIPGFVGVVALFWSLAAFGTVFQSTDDRQLVDRSDAIVTGTIRTATARRVADGFIVTDYRLDVEEVLKGNLTANQSIVISEAGGAVDGRIMTIGDSATYAPGESVLSFLRRRDDGTFFTTSMALGKFDRTLNANGDAILVRQSEEIRREAPRLAGRFADFIRATVRGGIARSDYFAPQAGNALTPAGNGTAPLYCIIGGPTGGPFFPLRWENGEKGRQLLYFSNGTQPGQNNSSGSVTNGTNAWTNDPNSSIVLFYSDTVSNTNVADDGQNMILFNNNQTMPGGACDGTVACFILWSDANTHTFNGDTFYNIVDADIVIRSASWSQTQLDTLVTHELGHSLGFRHSDQGTPSASVAIMSSNLNLSLGANLQQWDRDAIDTVYGFGVNCTQLGVSIAGNSNPAYGTAVVLTANVTGSTPVSYQWYEGTTGNTQVPVGTNSSTFTTPPITSTKNYWVHVSNACSFANSFTFTITPQACVPPSITQQPQNVTIASGQSTTLSVGVVGSPALIFQWYQGTKGDVKTPVGLNASTFTTPMLMQTTSYWVRIANSCGTIDSETATVSIAGTCTPPAVTLQPSDVTIPSGGIAILRGGVSGDASTIQWFRGALGDTSTPVSGSAPSNTRWVNEVFVDLLGRLPDNTSLNAYVAALNANTLTRTQIAAQITSSTEFRTREIAALYATYLHRVATTGEVAFQLNQMSHGVSIDAILIGLLGSPEYFASAGGTNATFVARLYNDILHRPPDASAQFYVDALNGGGSRTGVAASIVNSIEGRAVLIGLLYQQYLHRAPASAEQTQFLTLLNSGGTREQIINTLVGSGEYFNVGTILITGPLTQTSQYWFQATNACGKATSDAATVTVGAVCTKPTIISTSQPRSVLTGQTFNLGVAATWGDGTSSFQWYSGQQGDTSHSIVNGTAALLPAVQDSPGTYLYWVRVSTACGSADSNTISVTVSCGAPQPVISSPGSSHTGYTLTWSVDPGAVASFELQESQDINFGVGSVRTFTGLKTNSQFISHPEVKSDTRFFYRVRAIPACNPAQPGPYSTPVAVVALAPPPTLAISGGPTATLTLTTPFGTPNFSTTFTASLLPAVQATAISGGSFTMSLSEPWVTISPSSGTFGPDGNVQFTISVDSSQLPSGSSYATLTTNVTINSSGKTALATTTSTTPVNVALVTPVTPGSLDTNPPPGTLMIPAVAHADGINSKFQSDVRITNTSLQALTYALLFTPTATNGLTAGLQTLISIAPGETKAFDDIVKTWFGGGTGSSASALGTVEIRPQTSNVSFTTSASSRTYNVTTNGTFGQFIPALPIANFLAKSDVAKISLQQIAQSAAYRTNVGFVEGSGQPVTFELRLLDDLGATVALIPSITLQPFEHQQQSLSSLFPSVTALGDGRLEIRVTSDTGTVTGYASVLDNTTNDPLLVFPVEAVNVSSTRFIVPGVAELNNGAANFHTDTRIFNAGSAPVTVTLNYSPNDRSAPAPVQLTINAGEVKTVDNTLLTLWNITGSGGAVILTAPAASSLVVTARTFSRRDDGGTFGQFIPAVAPGDGIGAGDHPLEVLQLEQSPAFRSNLGLFELTGNPVNLEITAFSPDSKVGAKLPITLAGNQFQQLGSIFNSFGFPTTYNGRIEVRVTGGTGRVSAYGSVIDNRTQDPTYVPAQ